MNLREALVCLVESTECAHGADREGSALWRARAVAERVVNRLEEKEERRRRARERKGERMAAAKRATREVRWVKWERELLARGDGKLANVPTWKKSKVDIERARSCRKMALGHQLLEVLA